MTLIDDLNNWELDSEAVPRLISAYNLLLEIIGTYLDIADEDKQILALWIIAASYKDAFNTFPILFINASKGSGKTRLLKLIEADIPDSILISNLTESALFRICEIKHCILIDEAERLSSKEKNSLRELLNACYKRGSKVLRVEGDKEKKWKIREFEVYNPVALANIWGLESILEDRCITIVLQKSTNQDIITRPELFEIDERIKAIRKYFEGSLAYVNSHIQDNILAPVYARFNTLYTTTLPTLPTSTYTNDEIEYFSKSVYECRLSGRNFELWLPLFVLSYSINPSLFESTLELAKNRSKLKEQDETLFDRDTNMAINLYTYLQNTDIELPIMTTKAFIDYYQQENDAKDWLTYEFIGRFLKRIGVIDSRRRLAKGFEYTISMLKLKKYLEIRNVDISQSQTAPETIEPQKHII